MIVASSGRLIDKENSTEVRFPIKNIPLVRQQLKLFFDLNKPSALFCSGACGADILTLEAALNAGTSCHMILPFDKQKFLDSSVKNCVGNWEETFWAIYGKLEKKSRITILNHNESDEIAYSKTNFEILQKAEKLFQANINLQNINNSNIQKIALLVWDGMAKTGKKKPDFTDDFRKEAIKLNFKIEVILTQ